MNLLKAAKQGLKALEGMNPYPASKEQLRADAIISLRQSIEQAEKQEPVAWNEGYPTKHYAEEWFIAETSYGDRVVLKALPENYGYDFMTADDSYLKKEKVTRWMQFPDSEYAPPRIKFPVALRKMWTGQEVQQWLDENVNKEKP
jgi:hypothetical protein